MSIFLTIYLTMILFSVLSTLSVNSQPRPGPSGTLNLPSTGCQSTVQSSLFQGFKLLVWCSWITKLGMTLSRCSATAVESGLAQT